jgi:alpha(1,3/1,4) fucosyltransferase
LQDFFHYMAVSSLAIWTEAPYLQDLLFEQNSILNRDNCLDPFITLRRTAMSSGIMVHTQDHWHKENRSPEAVLFLDIPKRPIREILGNWHGIATTYVLLQECAVVSPRNWEIHRHSDFAKIFTWHTELLKNKHYVRVHFSQKITLPSVTGFAKREHWLCLIAGNKRASHPLELYTQRVNAIRWHEQHHPDHFNLYGMGWDMPMIPGPRCLRRWATKIPLLADILQRKFRTYRGPVSSKRECLQRHRFSICFENAHSIPGYITEKIIDCMMAGCVPIYWGAPDILEHIPPDCLIDFRSFMRFDRLWEYLLTIDEDRFVNYQRAMVSFLASPQAAPFTSTFFAKQILGTIGSSD